MSDIDLIINYPLLEEMSSLFREAGKQIEETKAEMIQIATSMDDGALIGETGDAFARALRTDMGNSLDNLREKFEELTTDITNVISIYRDGEEAAASRFR